MVVSSQEEAFSKQQAQFSLLLKLQINKDNKEAFKSTVQQLWYYSHGVTIREVGNNLFLTIFVKEKNINEVQEKSPWSFDKRLILLKYFNCNLSPNNVTFQHSPFWICVFNILIKTMNKVVSTRIAYKIGNSLMVDALKSGLARSSFFRIKVDIDITKPL